MTTLNTLPPELLALVAKSIYASEKPDGFTSIKAFSICSKACREASFPILFHHQTVFLCPHGNNEIWSVQRASPIENACRNLHVVTSNQSGASNLPLHERFRHVQHLYLELALEIVLFKNTKSVSSSVLTSLFHIRKLGSLRWAHSNTVEAPIAGAGIAFPLCGNLRYLSLEQQIAKPFIHQANQAEPVPMSRLTAPKLSFSAVSREELQRFIRHHEDVTRLSIENCPNLDVVRVLLILQADLSGIQSLWIVRGHEEAEIAMQAVPVSGFTFPALVKLAIEDGPDEWDMPDHETTAAGTIDLLKSIRAPRLTHLNLHYLLSEASLLKLAELLEYFEDVHRFPFLSVLATTAIETLEEGELPTMVQKKDRLAEAVKQGVLWTVIYGNAGQSMRQEFGAEVGGY